MNASEYLLNVLWDWIDKLELDSLYMAYDLHEYTIFQAIDLKARNVQVHFQNRFGDDWTHQRDSLLMQLESYVGADIQDSVLHKTVTYSVLVKEPYPINLQSETDPWKLRVGIKIFQESVNCVTQ
jgi:hypothetical protein